MPGSDEVSETTSVFGDRINHLINALNVQEADERLQHYAVLIEEHKPSYRRMWSKAVVLAKAEGTEFRIFQFGAQNKLLVVIMRMGRPF